MGGARTVKLAKLPVSSFNESVSQPVTIISARDASASEKGDLTFNPVGLPKGALGHLIYRKGQLDLKSHLFFITWKKILGYQVPPQ